jgi:hypothetical protein
MPEHIPRELLQTDTLEDLSVKAWSSLQPERVKPESVEILRKKRQWAVFRLVGVGLGSSAVIAKRCEQADALIEQAIYEEVLPRLPITVPYYYGLAEEPDGNFCWLFLEDAAGESYSPYIEEHRALAAQWLAHLHTSAAYAIAAERLADQGPGCYLEHLQSGRTKVLRNLTNPELKADDRVLLEDILSHCDFLESRWQRVEEFCAELPWTLVHGDFTGKNLRVRTGQTGLALLAFDWEKAGWGIPAPDLAPSARLGSGGFSANPNIVTYWSIVRDHWPGLDFQAMQQLANCGKAFRCLAALNWRAERLAYEGVKWVVEEMRIYQAALSDAIRSATWAQ